MIVISDMMGTLTTGSPVLGLVDWVRKNQSSFRANLFMAGMAPGYLLAKCGLIDWQKWGQNLMVDSLGLVHGATPEVFAQAANWSVEYDLWPKRREDVIDRLRAHNAAGAQVYIASSVVEPVAEAFARRIGIKYIGTPVRFEAGKVLLDGELVASERKIEEVLSRLGVQRVDVAYGDTIMDVPLLEHANRPVAVFPDANLRKVARERGWEIIGDSLSYP